MHSAITALIQSIVPYDALEQAHIDDTLAWVASGAPLYRIARPAIPPRHLVSYFALVDIARRKLLLVDHKLAGLWLPSGGHVEPDEHPQATVRRELYEELGIEADFLLERPLFLTVTQTVGSAAGHTDVSFWYVLRTDAAEPLSFDQGEFRQIGWFALEELPLERADPHMGRFAAKLRGLLQSLAAPIT